MNAEKVIAKLRLTDTQNILIVNAPKEFAVLLKGLKYDKSPDLKKTGKYDFVQVFATNQTTLERRLKEVKNIGRYDCLFWGCYPKGTGSIKSDINRETVWNAFQTIGMKTVTQIAIDDTWSAMRGRPFDKVGA